MRQSVKVGVGRVAVPRRREREGRAATSRRSAQLQTRPQSLVVAEVPQSHYSRSRTKSESHTNSWK